VNFTNPISGPIFRQLYFRQAMQYLVDQRHLIATTFSRLRKSDLWPCADRGARRSSPTLSSKKTLIRTIRPPRNRCFRPMGGRSTRGGVSICVSPGSGRGECGAGIKQGQPASFTLEYASGAPMVSEEMKQLASDFSLAGIQLKVVQTTYERRPRNSGALHARHSVLVGPGLLGQPLDLLAGLLSVGRSTLGLHGLGSSALYAGSNVGGYCDPQAEQDIAATRNRWLHPGDEHL